MSFVAISKVKYPASIKDNVHAVYLAMAPIAKNKQDLFQLCSISQPNVMRP